VSLLEKVAAHLESYDEAALIALSSKGLVRRAVKDLEREPISIASTKDAVEVRVGAEVVRIDERGPKHARCSCPARAACRHLLAAIMFLRSQSHPREEADPEALAAEILAVDLESLTRWAGKRILREAIAVLAEEPEPSIEVGDSAVISFPESMVECRWFRGAGLSGAITTARGADPEKYVAAAVIAFHRSRHRELALEEAPFALLESGGAPRTRSEVIASAVALFEEMIDAGLTHLTGAVEARLTTLSVSAIGANLPRLALDLKRTADQVAALAERSAHADEARLFESVARTYALSSALCGSGDAAPPELVGWHRTRYREIGTIELAGLGAYAWRTSSGYLGLTVIFREAKTGEWHSWSDSRPAQYAEYTPEERYRSVGPWEGMRDPALASRSRFQLFHARRNERRRLSASTRSKAQVIGPVNVAELDLEGRSFSDFALMAEQVESRRPSGLGVHDPLADLAVVRPARFGVRSFDEIHQELRVELHDARGRTLPLVVAHAPDNVAVIELLEKLDPIAQEVWGIMGRVYFAGGELRMRPFTLYTKDGIQNLGLDGITAKEVAAAAAGGAGAGEGEEEREPEEAVDSASVHRIRSFESLLEELAEMGRGALNEKRKQELFGTARSLDSAGLPILARAARALFEAAPNDSAARILRGRYLAAVHRELTR
jgi:hypothetical protein